MRSVGQRRNDVRRLVEAARAIAHDPALHDAIASSSGLSREGVALGFARHLELDPTDDELAMLVARAGDARSVHVVLSANVFVAPLRAIAIARAASERVVVRPSRRDPAFSRALVRAASDGAVTLADEIDVAAIEGELHVYGRDETIAELSSRARASLVVRGHGAGMGVAIVSGAESAARVADDVVAFDQRGCLSPRVALVVGDAANARAFAAALDAALGAAESRVPRGVLSDDEHADAARWADAVAFAGELARGRAHAVAVTPAVAVPPPGRHVDVVAVADVSAAVDALAPLARHVVAIGTDDAALAAKIAPAHARVSALGEMQRPRLDGPVDLRPDKR